jgi:hypothetical protein
LGTTKVAIVRDVGVIVANGVGVGEGASVAVAEEAISGEAGEPSGDTIGITGFELHAALNTSASNRIARNFRSIFYLTKCDIRLSL